MQETQVMPLSRFGEVEWVHRFRLESLASPNVALAEVRLGRDSHCQNHQYVVAIFDSRRRPASTEVTGCIGGCAARMWIPDHRIQIVVITRTMRVSAAMQNSFEQVLAGTAPESTCLDDLLYEMEQAVWDWRASQGNEMVLKAA